MGDTGAAKRPYLLVCVCERTRERQKKACRCGQAIFCISVYAYLRSLSGLAAERTLALRATFAAGASDSVSAVSTVTAPV